MSFGSNSIPTMNRYSTSPRFATTLSNGSDDFGKMVFRYALLRPMADGPSRMPPTISKMTLGSFR